MRRIILLFVTVLLGLNLYFRFFHPDLLTQAKIRSRSISRGDSYYSTLRLWYLLAESGDWDTAAIVATHLDPLDINLYFDQNSPQSLKKRLNTLMAKNGKTVEDWLELARVQIRLDKTIPAINSLNQAKAIDPVRDDIDKMLSQLRR